MKAKVWKSLSLVLITIFVLAVILSSARAADPLVPPTVTPTPSTVDQGQTSNLNMTIAASGGTPPYTYQWFEVAPNGTSYMVGSGDGFFSFVTNSSTAVGDWSFILQVTDDTATAVNSTAATVTVNSALAAPTVTPSADAMDQGQTSLLSSSAITSGTSPYSYQWFMKWENGSYAAVGVNSASYLFSFTVGMNVGQYDFILQVTDNTGAAVNSTMASVLTNVPPSVSVTPAGPLTTDVGYPLTFTSSAEGGCGTLSYNWYLNGTLVGTNSVYYKYTPMSTGAYSVTCAVTDSATIPVTSSQSVAVSVTANTAPSVSVSPVGPLTLDVGQSQVFTATGSGGTGTLSYQWCVGDSKVNGQTGTTYTFTASSAGSFIVYCNVTDQASKPVTAQSNTVSVTVNTAPSVSVSPVGPLTLDVGQSQVFTATGSGGTGTLNYQWFLDGTAVGTDSASYSYTAAAGSHSVTCKVTDSADTPVTSPASNAVSITVNSALVAPTVTPSPSTVTQSQTSTLSSSTVTTGTSPYSYQWFSQAPSASSYTKINGATSSSYSFATTSSTATGNWNFKLQVTDNTGAAVTSTAATVTVNAPAATPTPTAAPTTAPTHAPTATPTTTPTPSPSPTIPEYPAAALTLIVLLACSMAAIIRTRKTKRSAKRI